MNLNFVNEVSHQYYSDIYMKDLDPIRVDSTFLHILDQKIHIS